MSYKTCPEWPELMELAPDLQFKHISVADAQLPFDVLSKISHVSLGEIEMCADLEHNVFNGAHAGWNPYGVVRLSGWIGASWACGMLMPDPGVRTAAYCWYPAV